MLDEKSLRVASRWIYDNKHTGYWTYPILLSDRVDSKVRSLNLTDDEALAIFETLEELGLLKKTGRQRKFGEIDGFSEYKVNFANLESFYNLTYPSAFHQLLPISFIYWVRRYTSTFIIVFTALITAVVTKLIDSWDVAPARQCVYMDISPDDIAGFDFKGLDGKCIHLNVKK